LEVALPVFASPPTEGRRLLAAANLALPPRSSGTSSLTVTSASQLTTMQLWKRLRRRHRGRNVSPHVSPAPGRTAEGRVMTPQVGKLPAVSLPPVGWAAVFRKYFNIFRVSLIERMAYRGDFFLGSILRFLPMVTTILLWQAVYGGDETQEIGSGQRGYTFHQMIAYLLLVHISRMFSSMPGLAHGIAYEIRDGTLKKYLLQPLDMIG